jgi:hypothetical protein
MGGLISAIEATGLLGGEEEGGSVLGDLAKGAQETQHAGNGQQQPQKFDPASVPSFTPQGGGGGGVPAPAPVRPVEQNGQAALTRVSNQKENGSVPGNGAR